MALHFQSANDEHSALSRMETFTEAPFSRCMLTKKGFFMHSLHSTRNVLLFSEFTPLTLVRGEQCGGPLWRGEEKNLECECEGLEMKNVCPINMNF